MFDSEQCIPDNLTVLALFVISEVLSLSNCDFNGIFDVLLSAAKGCVAYRAYRLQRQEEEEAQEETRPHV